MKKEEKTIGSRIREKREELSLSQAELATKLGFESATAISLIENGQRGVAAEILPILATALHCDVNFLLGEVDKSMDVNVALRADKDLSKEDKDAIQRFIELAKQKKDGK